MVCDVCCRGRAMSKCADEKRLHKAHTSDDHQSESRSSLSHQPICLQSAPLLISLSTSRSCVPYTTVQRRTRLGFMALEHFHRKYLAMRPLLRRGSMRLRCCRCLIQISMWRSLAHTLSTPAYIQSPSGRRSLRLPILPLPQTFTHPKAPEISG